MSRTTAGIMRIKQELDKISGLNGIVSDKIEELEKQIKIMVSDILENHSEASMFDYYGNGSNMLSSSAKKEIINTLPKEKLAKDLEFGESIRCAGITWSKFAEDNDGNAYMLADEKIDNMKFGKNNDWRESPIRKKLNRYLFQNIKEDLGIDALVTIHTDLFSHDGLRDYGKCDDMISLLTYDLYRNNRENIKSIKDFWWLSTPDSTSSDCDSDDVLIVRSGGDVCYDWRGECRAVRPFFILKSPIVVSNSY